MTLRNCEIRLYFNEVQQYSCALVLVFYVIKIAVNVNVARQSQCCGNSYVDAHINTPTKITKNFRFSRAWEDRDFEIL